MKKTLAAVTLVSLVPFATFAATAEELQAQIQALLQQVQILQQQIASSGTTYTPTSGSQCPLISRTLRKGMSGDDVTRLQQFLARDSMVYPEGQVTGYYGPLTEAAVKRFQCKNQIVCDGTPDSTGYGVVGPRTAAILALQCPAGGAGNSGSPVSGGSGGLVGGYVRVTPIQGVAPHRVAIEVHVNTVRSCTGATYELFYGDASPTAYVHVPNGGCGEIVQTFDHTYTGSGAYVVTLRSGGHQTNATVNVTAPSVTTDTTTTTATTTTTTTATDAFAVSPLSGTAPLNVSFTGTANANASCSPASYSVQFGDGTSANIPVSDCSISTYAITHSYNETGTFFARFMRDGSAATSTTIKVGINPSSEGGGTFSASPGYGGDAFAVLATFELKSACTAYDIDWGDGTLHATQNAGSCTAGTITKDVTHTYTGSGVYTITLKRGTGSGQTTDTAGVSVAY